MVSFPGVADEIARPLEQEEGIAAYHFGCAAKILPGIPGAQPAAPQIQGAFSSSAPAAHS